MLNAPLTASKKNKKSFKKVLTNNNKSSIIITELRKKGIDKMKIDKRKKYLMTLDVETTNNQIGVKNAPNDGLVYDIGFTIHDKQGNIYAKRSFAIIPVAIAVALLFPKKHSHKSFLPSTI